MKYIDLVSLYDNNTCIDTSSSYYLKEEDVLLRVVTSWGSIDLREEEVEALAEAHAQILIRIINEENDLALHLSGLNPISVSIALSILKEKCIRIYNRILDLKEVKFSMSETTVDLLIETYHTFFPFSEKYL